MKIKLTSKDYTAIHAALRYQIHDACEKIESKDWDINEPITITAQVTISLSSLLFVKDK